MPKTDKVSVPVEVTEAMHEAFFRARDKVFPAQMQAARARGDGWKSMPVVVWEEMLAAARAEEPRK